MLARLVNYMKQSIWKIIFCSSVLIAQPYFLFSQEDASLHKLVTDPQLFRDSLSSLEEENYEAFANSFQQDSRLLTAQNSSTNAADNDKQLQATSKTSQSNSQTSKPSSPPTDSIMKNSVGAPGDSKEKGYTFHYFNNITMKEYIQFLSKKTNANFVFEDQDVDFRVTLVAEEPTNIDDIRSAFLQILRVHGLDLLEEGNNVLIYKSNPNLRGIATVVSEELGNIGDVTTSLVTRVFNLQLVNSSNIVKIIQPMVSENGLVEVSPDTHHLIVTDISSNVERIGELLKSIDNPNASLEVAAFNPEHNYIQNIIPIAEQILKPLFEGQHFYMIPQPSTDTIYIVASPSMVKRAKEVLTMLDTGSKKAPWLLPEGHVGKTEFLVYKLQFHKGDQIKIALGDIGADLAQTGSVNMDLMYTINSAQWIEPTNSLLFIGSQESLEKVKDLVEALDAPLRQVFIETLVIRTSITNSLDFGVQYGSRFRRHDDISGAAGLVTSSGTTTGTAQLPEIFKKLNTTTGGPVPVPELEKDVGLNLGVIGNAISAGGGLFFDLSTLVSALQTDEDSEVIMNPKIVTQDTVPATLFVGFTRPYQTNSVLQAGGTGTGSNFVTASIEYRQVGMTLTVTPFLGSSDIVTMEIEQSNSEFRQNATTGSGSQNFTIVPITSDSKTTTRVHVPNKHFLVLSGMIDDQKVRTKSAIPCLGGIPFLGNFMGSKGNSHVKDNIIIFLRPHIITHPDQIKEVTEREDAFYRSKSETHSFLDNSIQLWNMR